MLFHDIRFTFTSSAVLNYQRRSIVFVLKWCIIYNIAEPAAFEHFITIYITAVAF